ncbi:MAG: recombinase family protein [Pirellulales bacterium]|nr:recombinase family protein [Pirellulales bacterium]
MKTAEGTTLPAIRSLDYGSTSAFHSSKIRNEHLEKLAVVYVRQSSPKQVMEHRESRERQYALVDLARALGWPAERVLVIDDDQGQSGKWADNRNGFQRLLAEVTMDHGGIVIGLEMSRLARSSKDWQHLFELCGIFGTLLADEDGVYDAKDPTDRMVLGLKGIMSELELETMRKRLHRCAMNKAQRGELFHRVPFGYVILPDGKVAFDPDEQARSVVQLIFDKFDETGTIYSTFHWLVRHKICLPMRIQGGPHKGELDWRSPRLPTIVSALHNPIYAGAYGYGKRRYDYKSAYSSPQGKRKRVCKPMEEWKVLIPDRLPAYISWDRYLKNQERIRQNRRGNGSLGVPGQGRALLGGILTCGTCGRKMSVLYRKDHPPHYTCQRHLLEARERTCYGLTATQIDELVRTHVLKALEPAALELSMKALADVEKERTRIDKHWQQRLERARYEIDVAQRRYRAVDPDNRLVAATLEKQWEEVLRAERQIQEAYDRFQRESPTQLSEDKRAKITALSDISTLWHAEETSNADRKEIIRCLVDHVIVHVRRDSEYVDATIRWQGGYASVHELVRPVRSYAQLRDSEALMSRLVELRQQSCTAQQIANCLNAEGFKPPQRDAFNRWIVHALLKRNGLMGMERSRDELLGENEWWIADLARELRTQTEKLRYWATRGWIHGRQTPIQGYWIVWADDEEVVRLRNLLAESRRGINKYSPSLTTPKPRS